MAKVLKREAAKRDLIAQWVWYAENAGIDVADHFLTAADLTMSALAKNPATGIPVFVSTPRLNGVRRFPIFNGFEKILLFLLNAPRRN